MLSGHLSTGFYRNNEENDEMKRGLLVGLCFLYLMGCDRPESSAAFAAASPAGEATSALRPPDKTLEQVLAAYATARGGKGRLLALKSMRMKGTMTNTRGVKEAPIAIERKRAGGKFLRRLEFQGTSLQVVDGNQVWEVNPAVGVTTPRSLPDDAARRFRHWAPIEGPLVDPEAKGNKLELLGIQGLGSGNAYRIQVRYADGDISYFLLDTKSFLPVQVIDLIDVRGRPGEAVTAYKDFRKVGGVVWPFVEESVLPGMEQSITWSQIETDVALDDAAFKMPAS
jgi:hypothetical protein